MSARSRFDQASRKTRRRGAGGAASTRDLEPDECPSVTAATFDDARADFAKAWQVFSARRTETDYQAWRDQRDWTAEKYRRFDRGERHANGLESAWAPRYWLIRNSESIEGVFVCAKEKRPQRGGAWGRLTERPTEGGADSNREPLTLDTAKRRRVQAACP
jgi:hypothetical protein